MPDLIEAIVLSAQPYGETSLLTNLLTREGGVARAIAKGVRGARKTAPAAFEPLTLIQCSHYPARSDGLGKIAKAEALESRPGLRRDIVRLAWAGLGAELAGGVAGHSPHEPFFFEETMTFLRRIEAAPGPGSLVITLALRLLHHAGFPPRFDEALETGALPPRVVWDFGEACFRAPDHARDAHAMQLPGEAAAAIAPWTGTAPPWEDGPVFGAATVGPALLRWTARVWEDHLNTRLTAMPFLEKMALNQ